MTDLEKQAVEFMKTNGYEVGNGDLVAQADEVAFDCMIEQELTKGGWFKFSGDDACEDCKGWDGVSHRCNCGNRRMCWTVLEDTDFRNMIIITQAY